MESSEKIVVVVAETAPVISARLTSCLKRLAGMQIQPIEVHSAEDLADCISTLSPDLIIVNPTFSGSFDPEKFRMEHSGKYGLIAIQSALTDRNVARNFDEVISIVDDMDGPR